MRRESAAAYIFIAGFGYFFLAVLTLFVLPFLAPVNNASAIRDVTNGQVQRVRPYSPQEQQGRRVYIREGCFYCHSQYVRPLADEVHRYGPVGQIGEYAYDVPHLFGTHRVGPDLARVGGKVSDDWHYAHLYAPRQVVPDSVMPAYPWLFAEMEPGGRPLPNEDGRAMVAYLQKLGTDLGDWREQFAYISSDTGSGPELPTGALQEGKAVYRQRCLSCHGPTGKGDGPAAALLAQPPADLSRAVFKFRSTPPGTLPTDGDLYRTITRGLRGTSMPPNHTLSEKERWYLVQVIKTFSRRWEREKPGTQVSIPAELPDSPAARNRGERLYQGKAGCVACHGQAGRGAPGGGAAAGDWAQRPWKGGAGDQDVYRILSTGLDGTGMPAYAGRLSPAERWDIVHYIRSLRRTAREPAPPESAVSDVITEIE